MELTSIMQGDFLKQAQTLVMIVDVDLPSLSKEGHKHKSHKDRQHDYHL